jgi:hypothetical protein
MHFMYLAFNLFQFNLSFPLKHFHFLFQFIYLNYPFLHFYLMFFLPQIKKLPLSNFFPPQYLILQYRFSSLISNAYPIEF